MTTSAFRKVALSLPAAVEVGHMGHPDFRVGGKIFATLGYPDAAWAVVKLTREQQEALASAHPEAFVPVKGGWGLKGATQVLLKKAKVGPVRLALRAAWSNVAPKKLVAR